MRVPLTRQSRAEYSSLPLSVARLHASTKAARTAAGTAQVFSGTVQSSTFRVVMSPDHGEASIVAASLRHLPVSTYLPSTAAPASLHCSGNGEIDVWTGAISEICETSYDRIDGVRKHDDLSVRYIAKIAKRTQEVIGHHKSIMAKHRLDNHRRDAVRP